MLPVTRQRRAAVEFLACAVPIALLLVQTSWARAHSSLVFDETIYLSAGLQSVHDGRLDPRLFRLGVAPLPILLDFVPALAFQPREVRERLSDSTPRDPILIKWPRLLTVLFAGVPLLIVVFLWLNTRHGLVVATTGAACLACSPTMVAHASLATTDLTAAFWALVAAIAIGHYATRPGWSRLVLCAGAIALAMSARNSVHLPAHRNGDRTPGRRVHTRTRPSEPTLGSRLIGAARAYAVVLLLVAPMLWAGHLFVSMGPLKEKSAAATAPNSQWFHWLGHNRAATFVMDAAHEWLPRPAPLEGVLSQIAHNTRGHEGFLLGERSPYGWWYYFPLAFVFKSTPAELALVLGLFVLIARSTRNPWRALTQMDGMGRTMLIGSAVFVALLMTAHVNIGQRYMLPLYPLIVVAACDALGRNVGARPRILALASGMIVASQLASAVSIAPHYLSYFNNFVGGPANGWRLLADSNVDWGQNLPRCAMSFPEDRRLVSRLGTSALHCQRRTASPVMTSRVSPCRPSRYQLFVLSATYLSGTYTGGKDTFRAFRAIPPVARAGYSLFVFDLTSSATRAAFVRAVEDAPIP